MAAFKKTNEESTRNKFGSGCARMSRSLTHLHDLPGAGADGLESPEGVSEGEARLGLRPALHQLHRAGNQADLAGEVHSPVHLKCDKLTFA